MLEWLVVVAITLVAAVVVFGLVAKVVAANAGTYALAFGLLGLASVVVFWAGSPVVLAFGALACAGRALRPGAAVEAVDGCRRLAAVTVGAAIWLAVYG